METRDRNTHRRRRSFNPVFTAEIVELCRRGDRTIAQVAKDFDLTESAVGSWVDQAGIDAGEKAGRTTDEREELRRLRHEDRELRLDDETLKRATAFFDSVSR